MVVLVPVAVVVEVSVSVALVMLVCVDCGGGSNGLGSSCLAPVAVVVDISAPVAPRRFASPEKVHSTVIFSTSIKGLIRRFRD